MRIDVETNEEEGSGSGLGLRLSNDRIPVHLGDVLLGYARFRLDGHLQMINAPDDEERARSQAALANRGWIEEKAEAPATRIPVTQAEPGMGYAVDREALGRLVRDEWLAWAREQPQPKVSWLQVWDELSEPEREVDRRIGERLYAEGAGFHQLAVETLEAAAGKTIPSERAAGLIRYHLQNADICEADRAELAAFARRHARCLGPSMNAPDEPYDVNVRKAAEILGVHENTVRNWAKSGRLPSWEMPGSGFHRFQRSVLAAVRKAMDEGPSYHDLHITTDEIPRTSIFDLPYGIEVTCSRVGGWQVRDHNQMVPPPPRLPNLPPDPKLLGGEYDAEPAECEEGRPVLGGLRLDVAGFVIVDSLGKEAGGD